MHRAFHSALSRPTLLGLCVFAALGIGGPPPAFAQNVEPVDFNQDIRPILSNLCFKCHGPDENERKGGSEGLRLDTQEGAFADQGGTHAIVAGKPEASELLNRVVSTGDDAMPPAGQGRRVTEREVELIKRWIQEGAKYAKHWSYETPKRPALPTVANQTWSRNAIDQFLLARIEREGLQVSERADREALVRRVTLDLTGLPPTLEEVDAFLADSSEDAYSRLVDRLLQEPSLGEHWARMWLDLARYADSAGYADDPTRTIWAYRDYVIRAFNDNKPFDQFTVEQLAGDLLPNPSEEQLVATAFHRNTLTNSEGGTNDEEFRNVAVVDRVNTTWAVWMGTSMTCAQCHTHKYDPITQTEYFRFYAILNNTQDEDRRDEAPLLEFFTAEQQQRKAKLDAQVASLETQLRTPTPELRASFEQWDRQFPRSLTWRPLVPAEVKSEAGSATTLSPDHSVLVAAGAAKDRYEFHAPLSEKRLSALRLEALPHDSLPGHGPGHAGGNFVITGISATLTPPAATASVGRFVRIEIAGKEKILSLAEVQVFRGADNVAGSGTATQSTTDFDGPPQYAIDGNTSGLYADKSVTHTAISENPWWELDLKSQQPIDRIVLWNRTDAGVGTRLKDFRIAILDEQRQPVWEQTIAESPNPSRELSTSGKRVVNFASVVADATQDQFDPQHVLKNPDPKKKGWAIGGHTGQPRSLTLLTAAPVDIVPGSTLTLTIEQQSEHERHTLGSFRVSVSEDERVSEVAKLPPAIQAVAQLPNDQRTEAQRQSLLEHYLVAIAPELQGIRTSLAEAKQQQTQLKPNTVPVLRERAVEMARKTHLQFRGNYLDRGDEVTAGIPGAFHPMPEGQSADRLGMARWIVDSQNPLTARVIVNRLWEQVFGIGLVRTSEEFGSQGEPPSHPDLLDWLAVEFSENGWDLKEIVRLLVTSAAYQQSSKVTPEAFERDPENRLVARGPRFRLSAEMVRDQALRVSGLLSRKQYGPSVKPPQPALGLNAAFGSAIDWKTSDGADRYRRGLYTEWRRSNPYPSMITFDAPNREVCTVRRARTNTPLQALVTLNDPVYIECAQSLARQIVAADSTVEGQIRHAYRLCLARSPYEHEVARLTQLLAEARADFAQSPEQAMKMATEPIGPVPAGQDASELAAWTVAANILLNLDEMLMKR